ncbi:MAG: response regulator transcription factor [Flavobacteriales bacterium]|nr:response regulator transcription factor [Flavobacteriales bacterium]
MSIKILIVDDEPDIIEFIRYTLEKEGYTVDQASNGLDAIKRSTEFKPDLILMDVMMPVLDGIETCRQIKENPKTNHIFIVFLTARAEEFSELAGFEAGADDYIHKPIKPRVLLSRIKAILGRGKNVEEKDMQLSVGDLKIDRSKYTVEQGNKLIVLPKKEFELLYLLAGKPGNVFTRDVILSEVWGDEVFVGDRTIDVHIRKIREKIGDARISTIKGVGYKLNV